MTPNETTIVKALIAIAWADGEMQGPEAGVIEGMCSGFDASDAEEKALVEWSKTPRTIDEIDTALLDRDDRELLLSNAALLALSDGAEGGKEEAALGKLARHLGFSEGELADVIASARNGMSHAKG